MRSVTFAAMEKQESMWRPGGKLGRWNIFSDDVFGSFRVREKRVV